MDSTPIVPTYTQIDKGYHYTKSILNGHLFAWKPINSNFKAMLYLPAKSINGSKNSRFIAQNKFITLLLDKANCIEYF